ncbi:MAG: transglutaminase family protein [Sphingobium sp.]
MRLKIEAVLDYDFAEPTDILLALEAAQLPDQQLIEHSLDIVGAGDVTTLNGDNDVGRRGWTLAQKGRVVATYRALVDVTRAAPQLAGLSRSSLPSLPGDVLPYIWPSRYCEADRFTGFVASHFAGLDGGALVAALSRWVHANLSYVPGCSSGVTTAADTFLSRQGVCRDYAHLTAALVRACDIPARLVSVYALDLDPPDFHAVVEVWLDGAWHLVDSSALAPVETMVRIAVGRDATDIAFLTIFGSATMNAQSIRVTRAD